MSVRYARLTKNWMLRGWSDLPKLLVNWTNSDVRKLSKSSFYVAESCDGRTDFNSIAFLPKHIAILDKLIEEGISESCREDDSIEPHQHYRKADNPSLKGIHWCVTGLCNLNCRHCYMEAPAGRYGELPFSKAAELVAQFEQANVLEVSLTGGEPFLRSDLPEIVRLLARHRIRLTQIYSNGLLITDEHLRGIREIGFCPGFQISFDGVGTHDYMRGTQNTERAVIGAIRKLTGAEFGVVVATCVDTTNVGTLHDTYELMKTLSIRAWRIASPQKTGNWRGTVTALSLDQEADAYMAVLRHWLDDGKPFNLQLGGFFRGVPDQDAETGGQQKAVVSGEPLSPDLGEYLPGSSKYSADDYDCGACREQPNLLPDGTLVPCPGYVDSILQTEMPNLFLQTLSSAWNHSSLRRIAEMKKKEVLAENPECASCDLFNECGAGCRAMALTETGKLTAKDPLTCDLHKKRYRRIFSEFAGSTI